MKVFPGLKQSLARMQQIRMHAGSWHRVHTIVTAARIVHGTIQSLLIVVFVYRNN